MANSHQLAEHFINRARAVGYSDEAIEAMFADWGFYVRIDPPYRANGNSTESGQAQSTRANGLTSRHRHDNQSTYFLQQSRRAALILDTSMEELEPEFIEGFELLNSYSGMHHRLSEHDNHAPSNMVMLHQQLQRFPESFARHQPARHGIQPHLQGGNGNGHTAGHDADQAGRNV